MTVDETDENITAVNFFEKVPPGVEVRVADALVSDKPSIGNRLLTLDSAIEGGALGVHLYLNLPDLKMYCVGDDCCGIRVFRYTGTEKKSIENVGNIQKRGLFRDHFVQYRCENCKRIFKKYSIRVSGGKNGEALKLYKYGELPNFGPSIPKRVSKILGEDNDRKLFFMGLRCEGQGLGIGAFVYYRRVIESKKNRLFDAIINVVKLTGNDEDLIAELESAKAETQFSKSVEKIHKALPASLQIEGINPLKLLYRPLSEGVHNLSDEQCLAIAHDVRTIFYEFIERINMALSDNEDLKESVKRLL